MSPEPDDYYVAPDEYSAYVGNRVTADRPDYSKSPSWDAGLTDSDYETLRGLGYGDNDLRALFDEFYRSPEGDELNPYRQPVDRTDELNPYVKPGEEQVEDELNPYRQKPGAGATPGGTTGGTTGGGAKPEGTGGLSDTFRTAAKALGLTDDKGALNPLMFLGLAGILSQLNKGSGSSAPTGYQGTVPTYTAVRQQIQYPDDPNRRPGAGGRSYFTPVQYAPATGVEAAKEASTAAADAAAKAYKPAEPPAKVLTGPTGLDARTEAARENMKRMGLWDEFETPSVAKKDSGSRGTGKTEGNMSDLMDRVKAANPGLDWSKYNPGKMTMDYDEFDQARDTFLRNMSGARGRASDRGKSIGATGGLSSVLGMLGGRSNVSPVKPSTSYGDTPEDFGYTDEQFADMLLRQSTLPPPPRPVEPGVRMAARGGLMNLAKGRYLDGATDGMADKIPATIADKQPARLSHGEFVVPADVVSHLGNGNSNAGAERLYDMMDRIRKARTGNTKQGKQINPNKFLPT